MPTVIAHRGASGHRPEHTLAAYELAAAMGADYLEPDLVITADGVLVARHEPEISGTTDVADHPEFAGRRTTKQLDGQAVTGWFSEDFTLAELKTLRARERIPALRPDNTTYDGAFEVPTFAEVLDLAARTGKGVYPETKHPEFFRAQGLALEEPLADALRGVGVPTFVQSFSADSLRRMRELVDAPLVQLVGLRRPERAAPGGLRRIATYADAIGPAKEHVVPRDAEGRSLEPTRLVADAHAAGLLVHPYTFRAENAFLPLELRSSEDPTARGDLAAELRAFAAIGVDGFFVDFPDIAAAL